jgi:hypothetical protein
MRSNWIRAALCRRFSHLPWLADASQTTPTQVESMRIVCSACPVERECNDYVRLVGITSGFWAGRTRTPADADSHDRGAA